VILPLTLLYPTYIHNLGNGVDIVYDVWTNVGLVSSFSFSLDTIQVFMMNISDFFDTIRACILMMSFFLIVIRFVYHSSQVKIGVVSIWLRIVPTQIMTQVCKDSLTLRYP